MRTRRRALERWTWLGYRASAHAPALVGADGGDGLFYALLEKLA